jgi:hypothetical protein
LWRLPTRGALGNGLRVVAGAVLATGGTLAVATRGRVLGLTPKDSGETHFERQEIWPGSGTTVWVRLGEALRVDERTLDWARRAIVLAGGEYYAGRTSPFWYDADSFFQLLQACPDQTVFEVVNALDGCAHPKNARIAAAFKGRMAGSLSRDEAAALLEAARGHARPVNPARLKGIGRSVAGLPPHYEKVMGTLTLPSARGAVDAEVPYLVEAWARVASGKPTFRVSVNRTPMTASASILYDKAEKVVAIYGGGLRHQFKAKKPVDLWLNVDIPYMPITSDGKAPNLELLVDPIVDASFAATRRACGAERPDAKDKVKHLIFDRIEEAAAKASGGGRFRFSLRQLFYAVRPHVIEAVGKEPTYGYFGDVVTAYEREIGRDVPGMYRDERGLIYHPHLGQSIPRGTLGAESYDRPPWTFNKIIYFEKEGFFPQLRDVGWPERHDCGLITSKGFSTRAARDLIDGLGRGDEPLYFFCVHDADAAGTMIYQTLQRATAARPGRLVEIVNLGLDVGEALAMGLQVEKVKRPVNGKGKVIARPVADYAAEHREWLQANRVELNSMTTPQFLDWLDRKMAPFVGKVVPPDDVLASRLEEEFRGQFRAEVVERVLSEAFIDEQVEAAVRALRPEFAALRPTLARIVRQRLEAEPKAPWTGPVAELAARLRDDALVTTTRRTGT